MTTSPDSLSMATILTRDQGAEEEVETYKQRVLFPPIIGSGSPIIEASLLAPPRCIPRYELTQVRPSFPEARSRVDLWVGYLRHPVPAPPTR